MALLLDILSWSSIVSGGIFCVIGAVGLIRLPDVYCRMHAAGVIDTIGVALILLGLIIQAGWSIALAKLVIILAFVLFTSPTSCHALCRATLYGGITPLHADETLNLGSNAESGGFAALGCRSHRRAWP